jgi:polyisoprenyl-phosphate glycosyltransferase
MNTKAGYQISIIIPCFNEAGNVDLLYKEICESCSQLTFEIIFVNDGSTDTTAKVINELYKKDSRISVISFARNYGQQNALRAGLKYACGDYAVTIDADLQHPCELIPVLYNRVREGYDIVNTVRTTSQKGFIKNYFSKSFYRLFNNIAEIKIVANSSDFRIISRRVYSIINQLPERHIVMRAILPVLGFPSAELQFTPRERHSGVSNYTFSKSISMGLDALFNFTTFPLRFSARVGILISTFAFIYGLFAVITRIFTEWNIPGYTDIIASVLFLGGIIIVYLNVLGRYIQLILDHLKMRPEYLIESVSLSSEQKPQTTLSEQPVSEPTLIS